MMRRAVGRDECQLAEASLSEGSEKDVMFGHEGRKYNVEARPRSDQAVKTRSGTSPIDASTARVALSWLTGEFFA